MPCYLWMFLRPCGRGKFCDALQRCVGKPRQDIGEVIAYRDVEATTAFDHRDDGGYARPGLFASDVDPVASSDCYGPHRILGKIVAELQFGMIEEADQLFPNSQRVSAGLAGGAAGQHRLAHLQDVTADIGEQRRSFPVA